MALYYSDELHGEFSFTSFKIRLDLAQYQLALIRLVEFKDSLLTISESCLQALRFAEALRDSSISRGVV